MTGYNGLPQLLEHSARRVPDRVAVVEPKVGEITYRDLDGLANQVRDRLLQWGVQKGDRVGVYLHKSIDSVAAIFGILKCGAAYVPVDVTGPLARNHYILADCAVCAVIVEDQFAFDLQAAFEDMAAGPRLLRLDGTGGGHPLQQALALAQLSEPAPATSTAKVMPGDLAYILYTSGSTGKPKGVMLSQQAGTSYVDWCSETFRPTEDDRFSSHAPFHFDLSILDIYVPIKHGATLILVNETLGKDPVGLADLIADQRMTAWYSTPSILTLLTQYGHLSERDLSSLRLILFAGEVFPIKHLRQLQTTLPTPRYFNLYGPTETNVCTFYEIPRPIPEDRRQPFPIGTACSHASTTVVDESGRKVLPGEEGELCVKGPGVMDGYWNLPERTDQAFLPSHEDNDDCSGWYKTGDLVVEDASGDYVYVGRRDRMVKKRGYRVELGEIETALYRHPAVNEAAVIALVDDDAGVRIKAFVSLQTDGDTGTRPSIIGMKRFCAENLPAYMVPDLFVFAGGLPKTSTDKTDYQALKDLA